MVQNDIKRFAQFVTTHPANKKSGGEIPVRPLPTKVVLPVSDGGRQGKAHAASPWRAFSAQAESIGSPKIFGADRNFSIKAMTPIQTPPTILDNEVQALRRKVSAGEAAERHAACFSASRSARRRAAAITSYSASSSSVARPSSANAAQCSLGMLSRTIQDLTVKGDTPRLVATSSGLPAAFTISW